MTVATGTTKRIPSTEATRSPPSARASSMVAWCSTRLALAARCVSARMYFWSTLESRRG